MKDVDINELEEMTNKLGTLQRARSLAVKGGISWLLHLKPDDGERTEFSRRAHSKAPELELKNAVVNATIATIDSNCASNIARKVIGLLTEDIDRLREEMVVKLAFDEDDQDMINSFGEEEDTRVFEK